MNFALQRDAQLACHLRAF